MYIDFYKYPRYSGRTSIFSKNINESIQCDHGYPYYSGNFLGAHELIRRVGQ